jgi:hypothetical protein
MAKDDAYFLSEMSSSDTFPSPVPRSVEQMSSRMLEGKVEVSGAKGTEYFNLTS